MRRAHYVPIGIPTLYESIGILHKSLINAAFTRNSNSIRIIGFELVKCP